MLEEVNGMEKKPSCRSAQPPAKAGTEGKKNGDVASKYNRRREPNTSSSGKNEQNKKINASKQGKFTDKRPRPRGQYYGGGKQEAKVEDALDDPEVGSLFAPGRKKQNLNHLLNFTLTPRPAVGSGTSSLLPKEKPYWLATHKHKYNKEQFLQANCQFVVKSGVDYCVQLAEPDVLVDWSNIQQIRLRGTEWMSCPICLDSPVAAKMTRCGHVYCWPCILHYLALSDKTWRKCPICYEAVHKKDLKSVVTIANAPAKVGEEFTLRLMRRDRDTLLPIPVEENDYPRQFGVPLSVKEPILTTAYSKLLTSDNEDVKKVLKLERVELEAELRAVQGEPEICFIEQALQLLSERESELGRAAPEFEEEPPVIENEPIQRSPPVLENEPVQEIPKQEDPFEDSDDSLPNVLPEDVETEQQVSGLKPFYFYQAADGQNVFLTALNLRMLETQYGGLAHAPASITGVLLEKESGSMTRELRNRLRSISHLPLTATFELLELKMNGLLSSDVMAAFAEQLRMRDDRRRRRARDERRREKRITQEVEVQWGRQPAARIRLDSAKHFPRCGEEDSSLCSGSPPVSVKSSRSNSPVTEQFPELSPPNDSSGPSFAQMLKVGPQTNRKLWPRPVVAAVQPAREEDDEYCAAPRYQQSFSDAIAQALERADLNADGASTSKKKKKRKQKVLFSSGMAFTSN